MSENRSQQASRYGKLVEIKAARRYGLGLDHSEVGSSGTRVDARDDDGRPWDIKGAMSNRKTGPGRFRVWKDQHDVLTAHSGGYVFVRYKAVESGIYVHEMRSVPASAIRVEWGGSGDHRRNSQQAKILARSVFQK
jgi:hypothetical protein